MTPTGAAAAFRLLTRLALAAAGAAVCAPSVAQAPPPSGFPGRAPQGPPAQIMRFTAEPARIAAGEGTTLAWEAVNAFSLEIEPAVGTVATRGSVGVAPPATTTYTLTVDGSGGTTTETVTVEVEGRAVLSPETTAELQRNNAAAGTAANADSVTQPIPHLPNGEPDLSGVYLGGRDVRLVSEIRLQPGAERYRVPPRDEDLGQGALCLPPGVPAATMMPYPLQIVHKPDVAVILYEAYNLFRVIGVDVEHPDDLDSTWMGHSVARWDGDTLVVDVTGFNDKTLVSGHRHTEALHVVERYRRTAFDTIEYEATVEDPAVFAAPLVYRGELVLHPEWEIGEYVCAENNKDYAELFDE